MVTSLSSLFLGGALANSVLLYQLVGWDTLLTAPRQRRLVQWVAAGVGVMLIIGAAMAWLLDHWLLAPWGVQALRLPVFALLVGALAPVCKTLLLRRQGPGTSLLREAYPQLVFLDTFLLTNGAVLAVIWVNADIDLGFFASISYAAGSATGLFLVLMGTAALGERLRVADVPVVFRGLPILLITIGLMSLGLLGLSGFINH